MQESGVASVRKRTKTMGSEKCKVERNNKRQNSEMIRPTITAQRRYEFAAKFIADKSKVLKPPVVFDVGAGKAPMRETVERAGLNYYGFDLDVSTPGIMSWDLSDPCPSKGVQAGVVLLMDVIEHLLNPGLALDHLCDVLADDGYLLVSTPNPRWSKSRLHALLTGFPASFTQDDLDLNRHVFPVWPHVLARILEERGFVVKHYCLLRGRTTWPSLFPISRYPLRLLHAGFCKIIEGIDATAASLDYAFVARKEVGTGS